MPETPGPEGLPNWEDLRAAGDLPDDLLLHMAMLVYASDRSLLSTASRLHDIPWKARMGASLDHAVWIHHPVHLDDWMLYASKSPVAHSARGLIFGGIFQRDGTRIASVAQEALIRRRRS
jgi:acyl-CoA thioesterase-2